MPGALLTLAASGNAGGEKKSPWKVILPAEAAKELSQRSLKRIGELAKSEGEQSFHDLRAEAVILAATSRSAKDAADMRGLGSAAVSLATIAQKKDGADFARKFAQGLVNGKVERDDIEPASWPKTIGEIKPVMTLFENKAKKGEGIHPDLHYNAKVKNADGIETLINVLADKQPKKGNLDKLAKELELLSYRVAVIGSITLVRGPDKKKEEEKVWIEQGTIMRDSAVELAEAARKKDAAAITAAASKLENSCVECHAVFK
jgi:hypothetical protein